jgi:hypothetical protein
MANIPYGVAWRLTLTAFPAGTQCVLFAFTACWPGLPSAHTRPLPWRILIWFAAAILVIAIGFSRIYLGIHSPSDIVAGYLAATVWVGTIILLDQVRKLRRGRSDITHTRKMSAAIFGWPIPAVAYHRRLHPQRISADPHIHPGGKRSQRLQKCGSWSQCFPGRYVSNCRLQNRS